MFNLGLKKNMRRALIFFYWQTLNRHNDHRAMTGPRNAAEAPAESLSAFNDDDNMLCVER